jgi:hypothetical protein
MVIFAESLRKYTSSNKTISALLKVQKLTVTNVGITYPVGPSLRKWLYRMDGFYKPNQDNFLSRWLVRSDKLVDALFATCRL